MNNPGSLYIVSAPSGAGKTSLLKSALKQLSDIQISVSHTTRLQREGEENGKDYHFITEAEFSQMIQEQAFLEHAQVFENFYGTSKQWVASQLKAGIDIILEIDWQGARQIRQQLPDCISVFILPPSQQALEERLHGRAQDKLEIIEKRMSAAQLEMSHYDEYDYLVINDDFSQAVDEFCTIVIAQRLRCDVQKLVNKPLLQALLSKSQN